MNFDFLGERLTGFDYIKEAETLSELEQRVIDPDPLFVEFCSLSQTILQQNIKPSPRLIEMMEAIFYHADNDLLNRMAIKALQRIRPKSP